MRPVTDWLASTLWMLPAVRKAGPVAGMTAKITIRMTRKIGSPARSSCPNLGRRRTAWGADRTAVSVMVGSALHVDELVESMCREFRGRHVSGEPPVAEDDRPVDELRQLFEIGGDDDRGTPGRRHAADRLVDVRARPD